MLDPFLSGEDATADALVAAFDVDRIAFQAADATPVISSTTLVSSTYLTLPVVANATYYWRAHILYTSATAADFKNSLSLPLSSTGLVVPWASTTGMAAATDGLTHDATTTLTWNTGALGTGTTVATKPEGYIDIDTTAGNCVFQFAQVASTASNTTLKAGSVLILRRVA